MSGLEHAYRYVRPSAFEAGRTLRLATSSPGGLSPHFFEGTLVHPERTAALLLGLMEVVQARHHVPAAMLGRILAQSDPVVTCSESGLRFEGFSGCCGAYARVDLHADAVRGEVLGRGTTNVDFNPPMLSALAKVRAADVVSLAVGHDAVSLRTEEAQVVERRVALPQRWLAGFVEVQAVARRMTRAFEIPGPEAARFLRGLPRMKTHRRATWLTPSGRGLRLSQVQPRGTAVRVGGLERLRVLERLAPQARCLRVFADATTGATGWVLVFDDARFQLLVSPEVWRGFSGEGQALESIVASGWRDALAKVRAHLCWSAIVDAEAVAGTLGVDAEAARDALAVLGTRGLVGFDVDAGAYFHRELPFDLDAVEARQPRARAARRLVEEGKVALESVGGEGAVAYVASGDVEHRVVHDASGWRCTCPWYAKHRDTRGPCKHVLAVQLSLEDDDGRS